jgi:membrane protease subunit (stomatin/prohibitin family)
VIDDIGGAVLGAALGFAGRAIGRRMKKAFEERVIPAMEAKATQAQQQFEQSKAEQEAIVARYPELRGCTKDQVVFVEGGMRTVPLSEIKVPVTLAQADSIVARLR